MRKSVFGKKTLAWVCIVLMVVTTLSVNSFAWAGENGETNTGSAVEESVQNPDAESVEEKNEDDPQNLQGGENTSNEENPDEGLNQNQESISNSGTENESTENESESETENETEEQVTPGMLAMATPPMVGATATKDYTILLKDRKVMKKTGTTVTDCNDNDVELHIYYDDGYKAYVLNGLDFTTSAATAIEIGDESAQIVLYQNSTNNVKTTAASGTSYGIKAAGGFTIKGTNNSGTLNITGGSSSSGYGIYATGAITIGRDSPTIKMSGWKDGIYSESTLTINSGYVEATTTEFALTVNSLILPDGMMAMLAKADKTSVHKNYYSGTHDRYIYISSLGHKVDDFHGELNAHETYCAYFQAKAFNESACVCSITIDDNLTKYTSVAEALRACSGGETIVMLKDTTEEENLYIEDNKTIIIDLNGCKLKGNGKGSVLTVRSGHLQIKDSNPTTEHTFPYNETINYTVSGGCICGGVGNLEHYGEGGGIAIYNGSLILYGGNIVANYAKGCGGGVYINSGCSFTMEGGSINHNHCQCDYQASAYTSSTDYVGGGGVHVDNNSTFTMKAGTITSNWAEAYQNTQSGQPYANGGGVFVDYNSNYNNAPSATFNLEGGSITDNLTVFGMGGGVFVESGSTINIKNSPIIKDNEASYVKNGVWFDSTNNLLMEKSTNYINVSDIGKYAEIGITINSSSGDGRFTNSCSKECSLGFFSDVTGKDVMHDSGYLWLGTAVCCFKEQVAQYLTDTNTYKYSSIANALKDIGENNERTIELLTNVAENVTIPAKYKVKINLCDYSLTGVAKVNSPVITNNGELTITGPSMKSRYIKGAGVTSCVIQNNAGATLNIGPDEATNPPIVNIDGNGNTGSVINNAGTLRFGTCIISGGSAEKGGGIYNQSTGTVRIAPFTDGFIVYSFADLKITGNEASVAGGGIYNEGTIKNESGYINVTGNKAASAGGVYNTGTIDTNSSTTITGNTLLDGTTNSNLYLGTGTVVKVGSNFSGSIGVTTQSTPAAGSPVNITSSSSKDYHTLFTTDVVGYSVMNSGSGSVQIVKMGYPVCKIGTTTYLSVEDAVIAAGTTASTVELITNSIENFAVAENQNITLELAGYTITGTGTGSVVTNKGTLKIQDSSAGKTGKITGGTGTQLSSESADTSGGGIYNTGTLTLTDVKVTGNTATNGGGAYNTGTMTMCGSASVTGNTATNGGGVYNTGTMTMCDSASVTGNTATNGGGVYDNGTLNAGENITITGNTLTGATTANNLYIASGKTLSIGTGTTAPGENMAIGVTMADGTGAFTGSNAADYSGKFTPDSSTQAVYLATDNVLKLLNAAPTAADFTFAPPTDLTYSGSAKEATITSTKTGTGEITVKYYDSNGSQLSEKPVNVGTYTVKIDVATGDAYMAANDLTDAGWTYTITAKSVTITANNKTKTFGKADPEYDAQESGLIGTDKVEYTFERQTGEDVGKYTITPKGDAVQGNYAVTYATGELTITRSGELKVVVTDGTFEYNKTAHSVAADANVKTGTKIYYSINNKETWSEDAPTITNAGSMTVNVKAENSNYDTAEATYKLTVTPKAASQLTITFEYDKVIVQGIAEPDYKVLDGEDELELGKDFTVEFENNTKTGTATMKITGIGNYTGTASKDYQAVELKDAGTSTGFDGYTEGEAKQDGVLLIGEGTKLDKEYAGGVKLDGELLEETQYEIEDGCIKVTVTKETLNTLKPGKHTLQVGLKELDIEEPYYEMEFNVLEKVVPQTPDTSDGNHMALWIALLIGCAAVMAAGTVVSRKRRHN